MSTLEERGLNPEAVKFRMDNGYTQAQAERRPGTHLARHMSDSRLGPPVWEDWLETRDETGQLIAMRRP